jgi:hypothetical protein
VIEELAEPDRKEEIAKNGVIKAGEKERAGRLVSQREEESANHAEHNGNLIAENDMNKTESECAGEKHTPSAAE